MSEESRTSTRRRDFLAASAGIAAVAQAQETRVKKEKLGIGLIGSGGRGNSLMGEVLRLKEDGFTGEIVAVCDAYRPRLEKSAARLKAKAYSTSAELLKDPSVDAVFIATPDRLHVYHALEAVRAGKDVYCEKPLTHWSQFDKLKELAGEVRARNVVFQVGTQRTSDVMYLNARTQIKKGAIGKPIHVITGLFRQGDWGERGMKVDDPNAQAGPDLNWEAFLADAPKRPFDVSRYFRWRMYMDYSGGPVTDLYPHFLAPIVMALDLGFPKRVVAIGGQYVFHGEREVPDTFDALLEYSSGANVAILGSQGNGANFDPVIRGTHGSITLRESNLLVTPEAPTQNAAVDIPSYNMVREHVRNFLNAVRTRTKPHADVENGYRTQTALIMAMQSHLGRKVALFDEDSQTIRLE
jgi:predicted dehydrogenase